MQRCCFAPSCAAWLRVGGCRPPTPRAFHPPNSPHNAQVLAVLSPYGRQPRAWTCRVLAPRASTAAEFVGASGSALKQVTYTNETGRPLQALVDYFKMQNVLEKRKLSKFASKFTCLGSRENLQNPTDHLLHPLAPRWGTPHMARFYQPLPTTSVTFQLVVSGPEQKNRYFWAPNNCRLLKIDA